MVLHTGLGSEEKNDLLVCIFRVWRITGPLRYMHNKSLPDDRLVMITLFVLRRPLMALIFLERH